MTEVDKIVRKPTSSGVEKVTKLYKKLRSIYSGKASECWLRTVCGVLAAHLLIIPTTVLVMVVLKRWGKL